MADGRGTGRKRRSSAVFGPSWVLLPALTLASLQATPWSAGVRAEERGAASGRAIRLAGPPAVSPDGARFAFEWGGDIWTAPVAGGDATRLVVHPARESNPVFSPDGRELAFLSKRDDTWQAYVVPAGGGMPEQVTFHSEGCSIETWYPDGRSLLIRGLRDAAGIDPARFYRVERHARRAEEMLFDDHGIEGGFSPDGRRFLFRREGEDVTRQGYRGSSAAQIWLYDVEQRTFRQILSNSYDCRCPMWWPDGRGFYYLGAQSGVANLRRHDLQTGDDQALTSFSDGPITAASAARDGSVIVLRQLFDCYRYRPGASNAAPERIEIRATDYEAPVPQRRWFSTAWNDSENGTVDFSRDGLEMVFAAGGDLWAMDTELRDPCPVTQGTDAHDMEPVFAPDEQSVYFLRDTGDRVNIWRARRAPAWAGGEGAPAGRGGRDKSPALPYWWQTRAFTLEAVTDDTASRGDLAVSPDGALLACVNGRGDLVVCSTNGRQARTVAQAPQMSGFVWSPDSRWMACTMVDSDDNSDVWIVSADASAPPYNLSRNPGWDGSPAWSPDGRIVAYAGRTYDNDTDLYYVWLAQEDEERSKHDRALDKALEKMRTERGPKEADKKTEKEPAKPKARRAGIDFDDMAGRVHRVAVPGGTAGNLFWSHDSKYLAFSAEVGGRKGTHKVEFPDPAKIEFVSGSVGACPHWVEKGNRILWLVDAVPAIQDQKLELKAFQTMDPVAYQALGFRMAWRLLRDHFYDERMNGRDWGAMLRKYEPMAGEAVDALAFRRLVLLLLGELNASHMNFTSSEQKEWSSGNWAFRTAHLGLRFDPAHRGPGLKVKDVIPDSPADNLRSRVRAGELVTAIDGIAVTNGMDLTAILNGRFPREVTLDVRGTDGKARRVSMQHISFDEARTLLRKAWVGENRRAVARASTNTLGYLNIEQMNLPSLRRFEKEVFAEGVGKDGLIIDVRFNPGGFISDHLLAILCHPRHAITIPRGGGEGYPSGYLQKIIWTKPIVVLCNQRSASNAEIFSHAIKALGRGRIVGVPTQGSVISTPERKVLMLGTLRLPNRGWFSIVDGEDMELHGVVPDYYLWHRPGEMAAGKDVQLDKAVEVLLQEVAADKARPHPPVTRASERAKPPPATAGAE